MIKFNDIWLCNYLENVSIEDLSTEQQNLWKCDWKVVLQNSIVTDIFHRLSDSPTIDNLNEIKINSTSENVLLPIAIASLQAFVQDNFVGPHLDDSYDQLDYKNYLNEIDAGKLLSMDGVELNKNVRKPEFLLICKVLLEQMLALEFENKFIVRWWFLRYLYVYGHVMEEPTNTLYSKFLKQSEIMFNELDLVELRDECKGLLVLEIIQQYLLYKRIVKAEEKLQFVKQILNTEFNVEGLLGKRTKFQQKALPQLSLKINMENSAPFAASNETHGTTKLPNLLRLDDDTRLERITFVNESDNEIANIPSSVQLLVLSNVQFILRSQPKDKLADEELTPYLTALLYQEHGPWAARITALLMNIHQEANHKRTVERSLRQCEDVMNLINFNAVPVFQRLSYAYSSFVQPRWMVTAQLGELMISLGMIKSALNLYLQISKWEDVISCYTILNLRHKAAEIINQEIDKKPTVELFCLLGDATDDPTCYERAWEMSGHTSGRAQRHWGSYYFARKDYAAAIPHLEKSLEMNFLQENVWARLGFAALQLENWALAASAYRNYTNIEANGFESWNNLAKAYINLGDKKRAHKVLEEALKCNFSNWKVWENFLIVATDTGNFEDVINSYNQLIELKGKYYDKEILEILVKSIAENVPDADGNPTARLTKKAQTLLGHLCVQLPSEGRLWELAAILSEKEPLAKAQKLQKAYRCFTQTSSLWSRNPTSSIKVLEICEQLCRASLDGFANHKDTEKSIALSQLSSARLSAQGTIRAVNDAKLEDSDEIINKINGLLTEIKDVLLKNL